MATNEYAPLGEGRGFAGTLDNVGGFFEADKVKGFVGGVWSEVKESARPWGEFFEFKRLDVPDVEEIWPRVKANASVFQGNFLVMLFVLFVIVTIFNPGEMIFTVIVAFASYKLSPRSGSGFLRFLGKVLAFLTVMCLCGTAGAAAGIAASLYTMRLLFFKPSSSGIDVEAPAEVAAAVTETVSTATEKVSEVASTVTSSVTSAAKEATK